MWKSIVEMSPSTACIVRGALFGKHAFFGCCLCRFSSFCMKANNSALLCCLLHHHRAYGEKLRDMGYSMMLRGKMTTARELYDNLVTALNNVYSDVVYRNGFIDPERHPMEHKLFDNPLRVIDGPWYVDCYRSEVSCLCFCSIHLLIRTGYTVLFPVTRFVQSCATATAFWCTGSAPPLEDRALCSLQTLRILRVTF